MARSKDDKRKGTSRLVYAIPLVALVLIASAYAVSVLPASSSPAAMDFTAKLLIAQANNNGTWQRYYAPSYPVGVPGGIWDTHQYDSYGVNSHYPIYLDDPLLSVSRKVESCPSVHAGGFPHVAGVSYRQPEQYAWTKSQWWF